MKYTCRMLLAVLAFYFCAVQVRAETDTEKQARESAQAEMLSGRKLPPITPVDAPSVSGGIQLYPDAKVEGPGEQWDKFAGGLICRNIVRPTLTPFLPDPAKATGTVVIVAPGGAFMYVGMDGEGYKVAQRMHPSWASILRVSSLWAEAQAAGMPPCWRLPLEIAEKCPSSCRF